MKHVEIEAQIRRKKKSSVRFRTEIAGLVQKEFGKQIFSDGSICATGHDILARECHNSVSVFLPSLRLAVHAAKQAVEALHIRYRYSHDTE